MGPHTKIKPYWSSEDKIKLIALAYERPVLWNTYYPYYRELNQRKAALEEIQIELENKFCINSQWRNLKDVFYKKKAQLDLKIVANEEVTEPTWKYWAPLQFLASCADERTKVLRKKYKGFTQVAAELAHTSKNLEKSYQKLIALNEKVHEGEQPNESSVTEDCTGDLKMEVVSEFMGSDSIHSPSISTSTPDFSMIPDESHPHILPFEKSIPSLKARKLKRPYPPMTDSQNSNTIAVTTVSFPSPVISSKNFEPTTSSTNQPIDSPGNADLHSIAMVLDSLRTNQLKMEKKNVEKVPVIGNKKVEVQEISPNGSERFKFFGAYVESALRDIYQQSPAQANSLQQSIYALISQNQLELMNRNL